MPEQLELRPEVAWFAQEMERVLRQNDHKGGWQDMTPRALLRRMIEEMKELDNCIGDVCPACKRFHKTEGGDIVKEAADVANFAMMIADTVRMKKEVLKREHPPKIIDSAWA